MRPSERATVAPFEVMRVFENAQRRRDQGLAVYDLSAGQPSSGAPSAVRAAAAQALASERLGYTTATGLPALRRAVAEHYRQRYGLSVDAESVAMTTGSSGGFLCAFLAAFDAGATIVVTRPGYPAYRNMLRALGCRVVEVPAPRLTAHVLDGLAEPPDGVVLASPANPTGTMVSPEQLAGVVRWCDARGVRLISDEIYHGITYGTASACAWQTSRHPVVVNSFSKYFGMTGWRLGWLLVPAELRDSVDRMAGNFALCPPALAQVAALAAFDSYAELDSHVVRYRHNRDLLLNRLPELGFVLAAADGAFYVYADVSRWTTDSLAWCAQLLIDTGVAIAPGVDFDPIDGGRFVRLSFAGDSDELAQALDVMADWLASRPARS